MATEALKERLIKELEKLPEDCLREVLDFVEYLQTKGRKRAAQMAPDELDPSKDPILKLMGIGEVEPFSQKIDEELYGA